MAAIPRESSDHSAPTFLDRTLDLSRINLEIIAFAGLVLVSIIAHFWALGHMALHHDESIHAWSTWQFYTGAGSFDCAGGRKATTMCYNPTYHGPSLYSLTLLSFLLFGDGDAQARVPEAIAGILLVASSWMLRPYFGRRGALIAGVLLAITTHELYYILFFLFGSFLLIRVLDELLPRRQLTIGMVTLLALAVVIMFANPPISDKIGTAHA